MNRKNCHGKFKVFLPVFGTWAVFVLFFASLALMITPTAREFAIWDHCDFTFSRNLKTFSPEAYYLFPTSIALLTFQLFVIYASISTFRSRFIWDKDSKFNVSSNEYIIAFLLFSLLIVIAYWLVLGFSISTFSPLLSITGKCAFDNFFCTVESIKALLEGMAAIAITLLFCSIYSLVPTLAWEKKKSEMNRAREQLIYLVRQINYYFHITIIYFFVGGAFQLAYVRWLASNLPEERSSSSIELGIVFFNASLYMFFLVMILVPSTMRIEKAISWVEAQERPGMSGFQRNTWRAANGFPNFNLANSLKYGAALISPLVLPLLSLLLG